MKTNFISLRDSLKSVLSSYGLQEVYYFTFIKKNWADLLNEKLAKISKPVKLEKNILIIKVGSESWKNEFLTRKQMVIEMLNQKLKDYSIKGIEII